MADLKRWAAAAAAGMLAAQPCAAAEDIRGHGPRERRASAFAGLDLRLPLGGAGRARPSARLQLAATSTLRDPRTGASTTLRVDGFQIGTGERGKPALYIGGQSTAQMKTKLGVGGTTTTVIVVAGVVVLALVVLAATQVPPQPDFDD